MTTFNDDMIRLTLTVGIQTIPCKAVDFEWPPPEQIFLEAGGELREATDGDNPAFVLHRMSMSQITDAQRAGMTHVVRGAEYEYTNDLA